MSCRVNQWQIQDFPEEEASPEWGRQPISRPNFPENCMKISKIGLKFIYVDPSLWTTFHGILSLSQFPPWRSRKLFSMKKRKLETADSGNVLWRLLLTGMNFTMIMSVLVFPNVLPLLCGLCYLYEELKIPCAECDISSGFNRDLLVQQQERALWQQEPEPLRHVPDPGGQLGKRKQHCRRTMWPHGFCQSQRSQGGRRGVSLMPWQTLHQFTYTFMLALSRKVWSSDRTMVHSSVLSLTICKSNEYLCSIWQFL